jgi:hypothetical protein
MESAWRLAAFSSNDWGTVFFISPSRRLELHITVYSESRSKPTGKPARSSEI